ncbi:hypothetical protein ND748_07585 [Frankia sp. AiPs1]|uniref:hypothetical protein n=1 Tax=Frankia sp. AiPs1 TaxID=573493 RepID=UPI0020439ACA|nr:hypothetical protein [Frankia sp. AiPs1]MCM3921528.1 hypothetical protein [Frankia sp. AiPs1]
MSTLRDELHSLIDRLPESQVAPILALVRESAPAESGGDEWPLPYFVGALASGKGDLATRSAEIPVNAQPATSTESNMRSEALVVPEAPARLVTGIGPCGPHHSVLE